MKNGDVVICLGALCCVVAIHDDDLLSILLPSVPPRLLVGVGPARLDGKAPEHGAVYSDHQETLIVTLTPVEGLYSAAKPMPEALESVLENVQHIASMVASALVEQNKAIDAQTELLRGLIEQSTLVEPSTDE